MNLRLHKRSAGRFRTLMSAFQKLCGCSSVLASLSPTYNNGSVWVLRENGYTSEVL
jgi:hypothetical protein